MSVVCVSRSNHCFCLRYLVQSSLHHNSWNKKSTGKSFKGRIKEKFISVEDISSKLSDLPVVLMTFWDNMKFFLQIYLLIQTVTACWLTEMPSWRASQLTMYNTTVRCYRVTYAFQSDSTLYICLNVKELLAGNRRDIWSSSNCNGTRTYNHLVRKRTLNHLAKMVKLLSYVVSAYLYGAFDCMLLSCHVRISEWTHTLYLPERQGTPCSKQAQYLEFKWLQRDSNPQPLSS